MYQRLSFMGILLRFPNVFRQHAQDNTILSLTRAPRALASQPCMSSYLKLEKHNNIRNIYCLTCVYITINLLFHIGANMMTFCRYVSGRRELSWVLRAMQVVLASGLTNEDNTAIPLPLHIPRPLLPLSLGQNNSLLMHSTRPALPIPVM